MSHPDYFAAAVIAALFIGPGIIASAIEKQSRHLLNIANRLHNIETELRARR